MVIDGKMLSWTLPSSWKFAPRQALPITPGRHDVWYPFPTVDSGAGPVFCPFLVTGWFWQAELLPQKLLKSPGKVPFQNASSSSNHNFSRDMLVFLGSSGWVMWCASGKHRLTQWLMKVVEKLLNFERPLLDLMIGEGSSLCWLSM